MTYRVNGVKVTRAEFLSKKGEPIRAGDTFGLMGAVSFDSFVSPIDGSVISSKQAIREHERKHGVVHTGSDLVNTGCHGNTRKQDIEKQQKGNKND